MLADRRAGTRGRGGYIIARVLADLKKYPSDQTLEIRLRQLQPEVVLVDVASDLETACLLIRQLASLDPALRHSVMRHIEALNRDEGLTVICSLHDIDLVERYATRLVALRDGRLVWPGLPSEFDRATFRSIYGEDAEPASNTGF